MEADNSSPNSEAESKRQTIYRCKKCRRIVASDEIMVQHEKGAGFQWLRRKSDSLETQKKPLECSSIFIEPMKWMEVVEEGYVGDKLHCVCKARLGAFNWAGMQCNCGAWVTPAFQLHKNRLDECYVMPDTTGPDEAKAGSIDS
ncbi:hypothetical protein ACHQM5_018943 [Ranunculus cassubicifolius]